MFRLKHILLFIFLIKGFDFYSQEKYKDSLKQLLLNAEHDTTRCSVLNQLIESEEDHSVWPKYNQQLHDISKKNYALDNSLKPLFGMYYAGSLNNLGYYYMITGNKDKAFEFYYQALEVEKKNKNPDGISSVYVNIGYLHNQDGNVPKAIEMYHEALKIKIQTNEQLGAATIYNNIGFIFFKQEEYQKANEYYFKALSIYEKLKDKDGIAITCLNLSYYYSKPLYSACTDDNCRKKNLITAIEYLHRAEKLNREINNEVSLSSVLNVLGGIYESKGDPYCDLSDNECKKISYDKALKYYNESLTIRKKLNFRKGLCQSYSSLAKYMFTINNIKEAQRYGELCFELSKEENSPEITYDIADILHKVYEKQKKFDKSLEMHKLYVTMRDSILNDDTRKTAMKKTFQIDYEKKTLADSLKTEQEKKITQAQLAQERTQRFALYGGLALVALFGVFMYNRFRVSQTQNRLIQKQKSEILIQKELVDEKQKEILESIHYAKRIQNALLAQTSFIDEFLPDNFIFFKPKDIVSGDFYWATHHHNKFYLAICDSTGHGVPGGFMCLLNIGFLSEAINEKNITEPHEVFNYVRSRLEASISGGGQKDGFDGTLVCFEKNSNVITYASANNAPVLISDGKIIELQKDKMPVGSGEKKQSFSLFKYELKEHDILYLYTDGYADQFGGEKGKKFKYKALDELLLANSAKPMNEQAQQLQSVFQNWKGNLEQVDDILVAGIRFGK